MKKTNKIKQSRASRLFDAINYSFLFILMLITLYPFWYVIVASISDNSSLQAAEGIILLPVGKINFGAYKLAFEHSLLLSSIKIQLYYCWCHSRLILYDIILCKFFGGKEFDV